MGLLSDIYNTVARFFRPQEDQVEGASKAVAANRLKLVLMQDRTNLTPKILEQMRGELIDLLSKYLEMDKELLELNFEQEGEQVALMLSIPVIRAKDEDEIEEALKSAQTAESEDDTDEDTDDEAENDEEQKNNVQEESQESLTDTPSESECETECELKSESTQNSDSEKTAKPKRKTSSKKVTKPEGIEDSEADNTNLVQETEETNVN